MSTTIARAREIARGQWPRILQRFGVKKDYLVNRHGPCPICGGTDRFRFDDKDGAGTYFCNQCGAGDGIKLVMALTRMNYSEAIEAIAKAAGGGEVDHTARIAEAARQKEKIERDRVRQLRAMARLWESGRDTVAGDPIGLYLASRGIGISPRLQNIRTLVIPGGTTMMLARVQHGSRETAQTKACQLHRTILAAGDFTREKKLMPGPHPEGSAVRLFAADREVLGVAEGIETALSAATMFQLPVWAALTAGRLATFVPPPGVTAVKIYADNDPPVTLPNGRITRPGLDAAIQLATRLDSAGIDVAISAPPNEGTDWNDVLAEFMAGSIDADAVGSSEGRRMHFRG